VRSLALQDDEVLNVAGTEVTTIAGIAEMAGRLAGALRSLRCRRPGRATCPRVATSLAISRV